MAHDLVRHRQKRHEQDAGIGGRPIQPTRPAPQLEVPDLLERGDRHPSGECSGRDRFEDAQARSFRPRVGGGRVRVDDDIGVDEDRRHAIASR